MESHSVEKIESQNQIPQILEPSKGTSFFRTCFNGANALSGIGIISVPYALSQGGWLCLMILFLLAIICCYTGLLLQKCMSASPSIKTYPDIGNFAFGNKGRILISIFLYLELYFVAIEFLILEGDNLHKLFPNARIHVACLKIVGRQVFVFLFAIIVLPTTWLKSLGLLAYVSAGGVLASIVLVLSIFWVGAIDDVGFEEKGVIWRWNGLIGAISMYTFCYCGHAVFPTICNSMKDRSQFPKVSSIVLREDIVNLLDFIERLSNGRVQISPPTYNIEELISELMFVSAFFHLYYSFFSEGCNDEMSCISNEIHDLVQLLLHQSGEDMLAYLRYDDVSWYDDVNIWDGEHFLGTLNYSYISRRMENTRSYFFSHSYAEASRVTMTQGHLVELLDAILMYLQYLPKCCSKLIFASMNRYELLQNVFVNLRDFHRLNVNGSIECEAVESVLPQLQLMAQRVANFCSTLLYYHNDGYDESHETRVYFKLAKLLVEVIPVELEVMHICSTTLKASKSEDVGHFIKQLLEDSPNILRESLIHLQEYMVNVVTPSSSTTNIHVMIEFLLIVLTDVPKDIIHQEQLFVLLARVEALTKEVFVLVRNLEENTDATSSAGLKLLETIEILKEDLKNVFLRDRADSSQLCFPMSDGSLFMNLLLRHLNDLLDSNAYSVALIKEEIRQVKEDLELITSSFGKVKQKLNRDLWARVLDVAYAAEHAINSIIVRDHGLLQLIFSLPDTVEKIKLVKKEVQEKICKNTSIIFANSPKKPVENSSSIADKIIVGFEEERELIIRKLTSGPAEIDVISIVGMPGLGKTTLADRVYNEKCIVEHFDVRAWCTVDQERNEKKLLQKIYNQVIGLKERFSEDEIDDDVADKLRKQLFRKRYLIVLDDLWDTTTWDEITRPFPYEFQKGSRVILTTRKKEVALHAKYCSDPLALRLLRPKESWELLEKRIFREKSCPDELKDVGEKIARKCDGLPLVLDLIGGVIARKEKTEAAWLEVLNNLSSFIFKDEEEVMKIVQLSYNRLPDHLKPCLIYLASFPKDKYIAMSDLNDLWSAEGLMEQTEMKVYTDELISSSLVLVTSRSRASPVFQIHDLVHDFCSRKARKEKLFVLTSSSALSSSSSDLMPRRMTVHYDQHLPSSDVNFVLLDAEKENPYVKRLLSLKLYMDEYKGSQLPYKCHLRHLRLLKSLQLGDIKLTGSSLNEIGMLVHLKFIHISTKGSALPPSFSNLRNLETLVVDNPMVVSPVIWSLAKLRDVRIELCFLFDRYINEPLVLDEDLKLVNLRTLYHLSLPGSKDTEDIFKRFPNLQVLRVCIEQQPNRSGEKICFPRFDVLNELEELQLHVPRNSFSEYTHEFPSSLKKLNLRGINLTSDSLSRLPNLQELFLSNIAMEGEKEWNMEEVTFQNLISLTLAEMSFSKWQVDGEKSFPMLEQLKIIYCSKLIEIPESFGDIASLKSIWVLVSPQLKESALNIKKYVADTTGEDKLEVHCY